MGLVEAVKVCFIKYVVLHGRARRSEYWWFALFNLLAGIAAAVVDLSLGSSLVGNLVTLALFLPGLTVSVRRLHDTDRSGWLVLLLLVPVIGWLVLLVWAAQDGTPAHNRYGPSPKQALLAW